MLFDSPLTDLKIIGVRLSILILSLPRHFPSRFETQSVKMQTYALVTLLATGLVGVVTSQTVDPSTIDDATKGEPARNIPST